MTKIEMVHISEDAVKFDTAYTPKHITTCLEIAEKLLKQKINPFNKRWIFSDRTFKDLAELTVDKLRESTNKITNLEKDIACLEIIDEVSFEKGYIKLHKDVPNEILIDAFRALPTFWHLNIIKGNKEWLNISAFTKQYFSSKSPEEMRAISAEYMQDQEE